MTRCLPALLAALLAAGAAHAQKPDAKKPLTIRWHGQSMFEIVTPGGTRIITDPHAIEVFGRKTLEADLVLMSHRHPDHTRVGVIGNIAKLKPEQVIHGLVPVEEGSRQLTWNDKIKPDVAKDVRLSLVPTYHDTSNGLERGLNAVFVIETAGQRVVFLGDLGHKLTDDQLKMIGPVDVLMIPIGGVYTLNGSEAKEVVKQLKPRKYILPMHYGVKVYEDLLTADEFLDGQKKENVRHAKTNELVVEPGFKPKEPVIVLLHWDSK